MFTFSLTSASPLGDKSPVYGQRYWCEALDSDLPISFNTKDTIQVTEEGPLLITAEEKSIRQSNKGVEYIQLKKVKTASLEYATSVAQIPDISSQPIMKQTDVIYALRLIYKRLDEIIERLDSKPTQAPTVERATILGGKVDDTIDPEDIPF